MNKRVHVAVGVIVNAEGQILIAKRPDNTHQGGLWEFPGGKVEPGETLLAALDRELFEELDIRVEATSPVIEIIHDYPDKQVHLDVHRVEVWTGNPVGKEGQPTRWVSSKQLSDFQFPAANYPIVNALQLPDRYLITGEFQDVDDFSDRLSRALSAGITMVVLRAPWLSVDDYSELAELALGICTRGGAKLILSHPHISAVIPRVAFDGVHLNSAQLGAMASGALGIDAGASLIWGASCHSAEELAQAEALNIDYVSLSPVQVTQSHPERAPLGWQGFTELARQAKVPVYALGGMTATDVAKAKNCGGQGVAAIGAWW